MAPTERSLLSAEFVFRGFRLHHPFPCTQMCSWQARQAGQVLFLADGIQQQVLTGAPWLIQCMPTDAYCALHEYRCCQDEARIDALAQRVREQHRKLRQHVRGASSASQKNDIVRVWAMRMAQMAPELSLEPQQRVRTTRAEGSLA